MLLARRRVRSEPKSRCASSTKRNESLGDGGKDRKWVSRSSSMSRRLDFGTRIERRGRGDWRRNEMRICRCQLLTLEKFPGSHGAQRGCPMKSIAATCRGLTTSSNRQSSATPRKNKSDGIVESRTTKRAEFVMLNASRNSLENERCDRRDRDIYATL